MVALSRPWLPNHLPENELPPSVIPSEADVPQRGTMPTRNPENDGTAMGHQGISTTNVLFCSSFACYPTLYIHPCALNFVSTLDTLIPSRLS
jgi:hypothetical protein